MKALILAAGFGTRLLPFTASIPKPLFTVAGRPLLDIMIRNLQQAGCHAIIINTHHLHQQIESFIASQKYSIQVTTRHETIILGTGGAIKNVADFWDENPFMIVNSDILTDIDLKAVYDFHLSHQCPVTIVLYNDPAFNTVTVDHNGFVTDIHDSVAVLEPEALSPGQMRKGAAINPSNSDIRTLAFTGIQVLNPKVIALLSGNTFSSSIDLYRKLIPEQKIRAFIAKNRFWKDIGTPQRYREAVYQTMTPEAFRHAFGDDLPANIIRKKLHGDGSDRKWYRLTSKKRSMILADHGIRSDNTTNETDAFVSIGRHLYDNGIRVPKIYLYDTFSGLVFMEDLGDLNLQAVIRNTTHPPKVISCYRAVIDLLVNLSVYGAKNFDTSWTYQTPSYNRDLILDKECRYFVEAFLNGYMGMNLRFEDFKNDFFYLADTALKYSVNGFMHRDMQSRNIMVRNNQYYFIDFQGGRMGPVQYDLASLLIDPYVGLPYPVQEQLCGYCMNALSALIPLDPDDFHTGYKYCAVTRNLQILGAFGHLSRVKGKTYFEKYIPAAVKTLKHNLCAFEKTEFPDLKTVVEDLPEL
ncbi:MAG: phosphotransferase [Proteobacteria bacterium]|nr:phosphotransferase [Pseudomonadota bacterium]